MRKEFWVGIFVIALGVVFFSQTYFLPTKSADPLGPAAYPRLLAITTMLFGLLHIIVSYFRRFRIVDEPDPLQGRAKLEGNGRIIGIVGATSAYLMLMEPLGYILTSFLYVLGLPVVVGERSRRGLIISTVVLTVTLWFIFVKVLGVLVPPEFYTRFLEG